MGLLAASLMLIVMVDVATPSATTGEVPVMVVVTELAGPGMKVVVPSAFTTGAVIIRVLVSA